MAGTEPDPEMLNAARAGVRRMLGTTFAEKASDAFCLSHYRRSVRSRAGGADFGFEAFGFSPAPAAGPPTATVLEFGESPTRAGIGGLAERDEWPAVCAAVEVLRSALPPDIPFRAAGALRQALVAAARNDSYRVVGPAYDEIERLSGGPMAPGADAFGAPQVPTLVNQVCWLNRTLRTWAGPESLTEVAMDTTVSGIDVPRRLMPDAASRPHTAMGLAKLVGDPALTGRGVTVAVIDSEIANTHPALRDRVVHRRNYTPEPWGNPGSHGTAVAGIIGADDANNGGIAPGVTIYNYKVLATNRNLNSDSFGGALAIQQAVEDNVDIANCSWGAGPIRPTVSAEARAVDEAAALGMTTVKSAGNKGPGRATMTTPADAASAIVVGATDIDGKAVQKYSSRGPANASRPGPVVVAPGGTLLDQLACCLISGGFGPVGVGTSFAAPQVTGMLALLLESKPDSLPADMMAWVIAHGRSIPRVAKNAQGAGFFFVG